MPLVRAMGAKAVSVSEGLQILRQIEVQARG